MKKANRFLSNLCNGSTNFFKLKDRKCITLFVHSFMRSLFYSIEHLSNVFCFYLSSLLRNIDKFTILSIFFKMGSNQ